MKLFAPVVLLLSLLSPPLLAQEWDFPHISTTGYGEVSVSPDMAEFSVKVVESTMNAEQAKAAVDKAVSEFTAKLLKSGVTQQNISSSNLYINPQYHYPTNGKPELVGYQASRSMTVRVEDLSKLNQYLDIALESGINQVNRIQLKVRDQDKYQQQARMAAIEDAKQKAQSLAKGFERRLEGVWRVEYNTPSVEPIMMRAANVSEKIDVSDTYQDSSLLIRDRVDVVYKLTH
ncbi:MAG: oxidative stress defense protein [Vibrio sp.]|uniref:Oxidative stress defense protein n=1 Tax=Vibrio chanodichtyis TaxID=3027932 RepID=A0ABT5UZ39_9VIBR|nr:oxidative stress defense protein [Vibrio chanodichtyis]MDE1514686.1 oxidative stress defense protein [Vibrio chanodichtyis]